jgi:neutral ceramidase
LRLGNNRAEEALALAAGPQRVSVPLQVMRIDELGIAAVPCEVFAETGLEIKARGAIKPTFLIELANGFNGYAKDLLAAGFESIPEKKR